MKSWKINFREIVCDLQIYNWFRAETNCRIAHNLGILLMNSNCFAIFFSGIIAMSVQISIYKFMKVTLTDLPAAAISINCPKDKDYYLVT